MVVARGVSKRARPASPGANYNRSAPNHQIGEHLSGTSHSHRSTISASIVNKQYQAPTIRGATPEAHQPTRRYPSELDEVCSSAKPPAMCTHRDVVFDDHQNRQRIGIQASATLITDHHVLDRTALLLPAKSQKTLLRK